MFKHIHRPSTPTGQYGALVAASRRCKIVSSAFMMEIEKPTEKKEKGRKKNQEKYNISLLDRMLLPVITNLPYQEMS